MSRSIFGEKFKRVIRSGGGNAPDSGERARKEELETKLEPSFKLDPAARRVENFYPTHA